MSRTSTGAALRLLRSTPDPNGVCSSLNRTAVRGRPPSRTSQTRWRVSHFSAAPRRVLAEGWRLGTAQPSLRDGVRRACGRDRIQTRLVRALARARDQRETIKVHRPAPALHLTYSISAGVPRRWFVSRLAPSSPPPRRAHRVPAAAGPTRRAETNKDRWHRVAPPIRGGGHGCR